MDFAATDGIYDQYFYFKSPNEFIKRLSMQDAFLLFKL